MKCIDCNGTGMFDDGSGERTLTRCKECEGSGSVLELVQMGMMTRKVRFLNADTIGDLIREMEQPTQGVPMFPNKRVRR